MKCVTCPRRAVQRSGFLVQYPYGQPGIVCPLNPHCRSCAFDLLGKVERYFGMTLGYRVVLVVMDLSRKKSC